MYRAILTNKQKRYVIGDDFWFTYRIVDENGDFVNTLSGWTFRGELYSLANSIPNSQISITTTSNRINLSISNLHTQDLNANVRYILILKGTLDSKDYSLSREIFYLEEEILD
jgi:hypothetical protein